MGEGTKQIQRHKKARKRLADVIGDADRVVVIHYSCESFYDRSDGSSPRITSIAVLNLETRQTQSFSIHQMAERVGYSPIQLEQHYNELEKLMLDEFYEYVRTHAGYTWLHWNMRNINFGFQALAHRHKTLGGQPVEIHDSQLVDLSNLLIKIYGVRYVGHPRLPNLVDLNNITRKDFLTGPEEAEAFERKDYVKLHQSTLRKVDILASVTERAYSGRLKTHASITDKYGSYPDALGEFLREHWGPTIVAFISAVIGIVAFIWAFF